MNCCCRDDVIEKELQLDATYNLWVETGEKPLYVGLVTFVGPSITDEGVAWRFRIFCNEDVIGALVRWRRCNVTFLVTEVPVEQQNGAESFWLSCSDEDVIARFGSSFGVRPLMRFEEDEIQDYSLYFFRERETSLLDYIVSPMDRFHDAPFLRQRNG